MRIVITGGMGCGKSTITNYLRSRLSDHDVFDVDVCVRELYDDDIVQMMLDAEFDTHDRTRISDIVFRSPDAKTRLYAIMNAAILNKLQIAAKNDRVIIDMPLYFEFQHNLHISIDHTICVSCSPSTQFDRIKKRDGFTDEKISSILSQQLPLSEKERRADFVIHTDTDVPATEQLEKILKLIGIRCTTLVQ